MQHRWLSLDYNQNPRGLCCRLLHSLLILTLFTAPLYVPLTDTNLLVTVVPFCTVQKRVLYKAKAKSGILEWKVESEFLLQMMLTGLFNLEFLKVFFAKQVRCCHGKQRWNNSLPSSRSLSIFFYLTSSYFLINNSLESKCISAQGFLVLLLGSFLHPSICCAQVQGTFNEDIQVKDQQPYRIRLNITTAQEAAFKIPDILGCSNRYYRIKLDEILREIIWSLPQWGTITIGTVKFGMVVLQDFRSFSV